MAFSILTCQSEEDETEVLAPEEAADDDEDEKVDFENYEDDPAKLAASTHTSSDHSSTTHSTTGYLYNAFKLTILGSEDITQLKTELEKARNEIRKLEKDKERAKKDRFIEFPKHAL